VTRARLPWSGLLPGVLLPNLCYATGRGAVVPVIPLLAVELGVGYAGAALVAAMLTVGELVTTITATWLVLRIGERGAMFVGAALTAAGSVLAVLATDAALLGIGVLLIGSASAIYLMARQAWVAVAVPRHQRGRAYSLVAGSQRLGMLVGPFLSAVIISTAHHERWAFVVPIVASAFVPVILLSWPVEPEPVELDLGTDPVTGAHSGVLRTFVQRRDVLLRLGSAAGVLASMRAVRLIIVPLWGAGLGLSAVQVTLVVGVCNFIDVALFYVGGWVTDQVDSRWVGVPTLTAYALAHGGLALSGVLPAEIQIYIGLSLFMAVANGISSGFIATMAADLADPRRPAAFLGPWRLVTETFNAGVPLLFATVTGAVSLVAAAASMGTLALAGAVAMWVYIPRFSTDKGTPSRE